MEYEAIKKLKENSESSLSLYFFFDKDDNLISMSMETNGIRVKKFSEKYNISELLEQLVKIEQKGLKLKQENQVDELFKKPFVKND